jgi:ketosteroid isomerase-like protein
MSESPASAVVRRQLAALERGNPQEVLDNFDANAVLVDMSDPDNERTGDAVRDTVRDFRGGYDDMKIDIKTIFDDGRMVLCECDIAGTRKDNGRWEVVHYAIIAAVENDKLVMERYYWNPAELAVD